MFKKLAIKFLGSIQKGIAYYRISNMQTSLNPNILKLHLALKETLEGKLHPEELVYIREIESLREEMQSSKNQFIFIDYGAGAPNSARTAAESYQGVNSSKSLSEVVLWSKPYFWGLLMSKLVRHFAVKKCLELGTCVGISGSYIASPLQVSGQGELVTMEGDARLAKIAKENFDRLGLDNVSVVKGRFHDTLEQGLADGKQFDFVFIDGHHDEESTLKYFDLISTHLSEGAIVIFDDIMWSPGMKRAWKALKDHFSITIDLSVFGVCIFSNSFENKYDKKIPLNFTGTSTRFNSP